MSKIKEIYLMYYNSSAEDGNFVYKTCHATWHNNKCGNKCTECSLQKLKELFREIHDLCEKELVRDGND